LLGASSLVTTFSGIATLLAVAYRAEAQLLTFEAGSG
jgi:hypothetical protein